MGCSSCGKNKSTPARKRMLPSPKGVPAKRRLSGTTRKKRPIPSRRRPR
tara:strand:- start:498 stop:644 length:147 start_codon:yes stop_codon:yes gene_type:complete